MDYRDLKAAMDSAEGTAEILHTAATILRDIAGGHRDLLAVRHPLGFLCLPVLRAGGTGACVHVFDLSAGGPVTEQAASQIHAHSWELTSCVLYGEVQNLCMRVTEDARRPTHRVFEVLSDSADGVDDIRPTPRLVRCASGARQASTRGQVYRLPAGEFHTTRVEWGHQAATFVLGRSLPGGADLSLGPPHATGHRMTRQACDTPSTLRIARAVLRRMDAAPPA